MLRKIQEKIQSVIAFAPVLFYGRGVFQYTFGMIPHRRPVHVVGEYYYSCYCCCYDVCDTFRQSE